LPSSGLNDRSSIPESSRNVTSLVAMYRLVLRSTQPSNQWVPGSSYPRR
jgi:hypothetical protein